MNIRSAIAEIRRQAVIRQGSFVAVANRLKNGSITLISRLRQFYDMKTKDFRKPKPPPVTAPTDNYPELLQSPKDTQCPTLREEIRPPVFILLGRHSELIQMLPAFKEIHDQTGLKPILIVSYQFADLLDGVSYVACCIITDDFYAGMPHARMVAETTCGGVTLQSWNKGVAVEQDPSGAIILQSFGMGWGVEPGKSLSYGHSMWERAGFAELDMLRLPLVFDQRDLAREKTLINIVQQGNRQKKPLFLYNFAGVHTMFGYTPEIQQALQPLNKTHYLVNLSQLRPLRVFDLVGLFEKSAGMLTVDSFHLHLAAATQMPYAAYVEDGWSGSVPKGNCFFQTNYSKAKQQIPELRAAMAKVFQW